MLTCNFVLQFDEIHDIVGLSSDGWNLDFWRWCMNKLAYIVAGKYVEMAGDTGILRLMNMQQGCGK